MKKKKVKNKVCVLNFEVNLLFILGFGDLTFYQAKAYVQMECIFLVLHFTGAVPAVGMY